MEFSISVQRVYIYDVVYQKDLYHDQNFWGKFWEWDQGF